MGTALSTQVEQSMPEAIHVVEVSSFQLELTATFRPWIAVFLNLYADHLDRYADIEAYAAAKARLFANQRASDTLVVNADDPDVLRLTRDSHAGRVAYALREWWWPATRLCAGARLATSRWFRCRRCICWVGICSETSWRPAPSRTWLACLPGT